MKVFYGWRWLLVGSLVFAVASCAKVRVVRDTDGSSLQRGATYYLPKTVIDVTVPIERTTKTPGVFWRYAEVLFGKEPDVQKPETSYELGEDPAISFSSVKDTEHRYVSIYARGLNAATQVYAWNSEGVLNSGDATVTNRTLDYVVAATKAASGLATSSMRLANLGAPGVPVNSDAYRKLCKYLNGLEGGKGTDFEPRNVVVIIESIREDAALGPDEIQLAKDRPKAFDELSAAATVYAEIENLRDGLGSTGSDKAAELLEEKLQEQRDLFFGTERTEGWKVTFKIAPEQGTGARNYYLFAIDEDHGVVWHRTPELSVPLDGKRASTSKNVYVRLEPTVPDTASSWEAALNNQRRRSEHGWYYRVPAMSTITLLHGNARLVKVKQGIGQLGHIAYLPVTGGGVKFTSNIKLDPVTGALTSLTYGTEPADPAFLESLSGSASSVIEAVGTRRAEAAAANSTLQRLREQKEELELRAAIESLKSGSE